MFMFSFIAISQTGAVWPERLKNDFPDLLIARQQSRGALFYAASLVAKLQTSVFLDAPLSGLT